MSKLLLKTKQALTTIFSADIWNESKATTRTFSITLCFKLD